jgi:hypothetical protein
MIDVEGRLETGGLSAFGGTRWCRWPPPSARPHPARPGGPVAQTRRAPDQAAVPGQNGRGFRRFDALVFEAPPHDRPMTSAPRGSILRIAPGQTRMKTQDLVQTRKDPDGL